MSTKLRALVIDDSGVMRKMVMKSLSEAQLAEFEFVEAVDGKDALEKLAANEIHLAFVDWNMPNMTGVDFVREVRKQERLKEEAPIPLVMVTSEKTMGKVQEALDEAGADGFISKPFTVEELQRKLKKHIEKAEFVLAKRLRRQRELAEAQGGAKSSGGFWSSLMG